MKKRMISVLLALAMVVSLLPGTAFAAGLFGDADGSGDVDYLDAMIVLQYHTGTVGDDALDLTVCDVDCNGEVDYLDAMMILQYHTGVLPELHEHEWVDATCETAKTCKSCGATEGAAAGHSWKDATCTTPKTCSKCGATESSAVTDHNYVETAQTDGYKVGSVITYRCTLCGHTKEQTIEKLSLSANRSSLVSINGWISQVGYTANATGGYGSYQYKFEVYTSENSVTPALTEGFSAYNSFGWTSRYYCNGHVLVITVQDEAGNKAALKIVVDVNDTITEVKPTDPAVSEDRTAPVINYISIDKHEVTVGDKVNITMSITDDSKITTCQVLFHMSNGAVGNAACYPKLGDDGLYHGVISIDSTFVSGKCTISSVWVEDASDNEVRLYNPEEVYPDIYFNVIGGADDTVAPVINDISIDKHEVTVGDKVNITMSITDDSKITTCQVLFHMSNGAVGNAACYPKLGDDGLYHGVISIDSTFVSGKCTISSVWVEDASDNEVRLYNPEEVYPDIYFNVNPTG